MAAATPRPKKSPRRLRRKVNGNCAIITLGQVDATCSTVNLQIKGTRTMHKISIAIDGSDIGKIVDKTITGRELTTLTEDLLKHEFPGLALDLAGDVFIKNHLRLVDQNSIWEMLYDKIITQLDKSNTIIWCPVQDNGLDYYVGYAPGNIRYLASKFLIHHEKKDAYIALRSELSLSKGMPRGAGRLTSCLNADIKAAVTAGPPASTYETHQRPHKIRRLCPYKQVPEEFDITEIESLHRGISDSQFTILSHANYPDLAAVQAACKHDWENCKAADKIVWYNSMGHGFSHLCGYPQLDTESLSYAVDFFMPAEGVNNYSVQVRAERNGELQRKMLKKNLPVAAALEFCEQDYKARRAKSQDDRIALTL